jgi:hypothetical protein
MTLEENKALLRRFFENAPHTLDTHEEIFSQTFWFRSIQHITLNAETQSMPQEEKKIFQRLNTTWSAWLFVVDEIIDENKRVLVRWPFTGTYQGDYLGLPPTNRLVKYSGMNTLRIVDGRIAEVTNISDHQ